MSLTDLLSATQADMKQRIESECSKMMQKLLEESFSAKWEEYTQKTVESALAISYFTNEYGKITKETVNENIYTLMSKITFPSTKMYFIHCCLKDTYNGLTNTEFYLIDNYGFVHRCSYAQSGYCHPKESVVVNIKDYIYPLSDALIDIIKSMPTKVAQARPAHGDQGGNLDDIVKCLPKIRDAARIFHEQATVVEKLIAQKKMYESTLAENSALKEKIASLETRLMGIDAAPPSEDLLGLSSNTVLVTEPSKFTY
jgi:hypothetical protein